MSYGLGPTFYYLSKAQVELGNQVSIVARRHKASPNYEMIDGLHVHRVPSPYNVFSLKKLFDIDASSQVDVVHTHATSGVSYALFHRLIARKPLIVHVHGIKGGVSEKHVFTSISDKLKRGYLSIATHSKELVMLKQADIIVTVSSYISKELIENLDVDRKKIRVAHNGVDTDLFYPSDDAHRLKAEHGLSDKKVVLYVGHFGIRKGLSTLIRAMPTVIRELPQTVLMLIGGTPEWLGTTRYWNVLRNEISLHGLQDNVLLMGSIPHTELPRYYSMTDVFVLPSHREALGKVLLEAMACGKPVIATRNGGPSEIVEDGVDGFLTTYGDSVGLSEAIKKILSDESLRSKMGKAGYRKVVERFTWQQTARRINQIYKEVI